MANGLVWYSKDAGRRVWPPKGVGGCSRVPSLISCKHHRGMVVGFGFLLILTYRQYAASHKAQMKHLYSSDWPQAVWTGHRKPTHAKWAMHWPCGHPQTPQTPLPQVVFPHGHGHSVPNSQEIQLVSHKSRKLALASWSCSCFSKSRKLALASWSCSCFSKLSDGVDTPQKPQIID